MTTSTPVPAAASNPTFVCRLYVVDEELRVVLSGTDPANLLPVVAGTPDAAPPELSAALARLIPGHDFTREPMAFANLAPRLAMRCMRSSGPAGTFFMVVTAELHGSLGAVA